MKVYIVELNDFSALDEIKLFRRKSQAQEYLSRNIRHMKTYCQSGYIAEMKVWDVYGPSYFLAKSS